MVIKKIQPLYKSNLIKIKNKFFYNKNFKSPFYDFGVMLFKKFSKIN